MSLEPIEDEEPKTKKPSYGLRQKHRIKRKNQLRRKRALEEKQRLYGVLSDEERGQLKILQDTYD